MSWKKGPLPKDTFNWGGVVPVGLDSGFYFADFWGDHVIVVPTGKRLEPHEVAYYNNCLTEPTHAMGQAHQRLNT
jgi:hypothetical protein